MDPEVLLLCSQEPNISSCSDQLNLVHSIPSYLFKFYFNIIFQLFYVYLPCPWTSLDLY